MRHFLAEGARGGQLPDDLSALADELVHEQTRLLGDMEAMGQHIALLPREDAEELPGGASLR